MNDNGYVYVLMNPSLQNMVKIGKTTRNPEERAKELSTATGVPTPFVVVYSCLFESCTEAEAFVHTYLELKGFRISSNREFFEIPITEAIDSVIKAKEHFGDFLLNSESSKSSEDNEYSDNIKKLIDIYQTDLSQELKQLIDKNLIKNSVIVDLLYLIDYLIEMKFIYTSCSTIYVLFNTVDSEELFDKKYFNEYDSLIEIYATDTNSNELIDTAENILNIIPTFISQTEDEELIIKYNLFSSLILDSLNNKIMNRLGAIILDFGKLTSEFKSENNDSEISTEPEVFDIACKYFTGKDDYLQDYKEAERYFKKAIALGSILSYSYLAMIYRFGLGTKIDLNIAIDYYKQGVNKGFIQCYMDMAEIYLKLNHIDNAIKCWEKYSSCIFKDDSPEYSNYMDFLIELRDKNKISENKERLKNISNKIYTATDAHLKTFLDDEQKMSYLNQIRDCVYPDFL
jgi:tetratricopeptide (TPR) repeat protein